MQASTAGGAFSTIKPGLVKRAFAIVNGSAIRPAARLLFSHPQNSSRHLLLLRRDRDAIRASLGGAPSTYNFTLLFFCKAHHGADTARYGARAILQDSPRSFAQLSSYLSISVHYRSPFTTFPFFIYVHAIFTIPYARALYHSSSRKISRTNTGHGFYSG